jgi:hypothetical protein
MKPIRRHLNYANVVATLALVFAMSGGALAASHYLVNSTKQINPKVLKKLKGNRGPAGLPGIAIQGASGLDGAKGARGEAGHEGPAGLSALSVLPSGQSESGDYAIRPDNTAAAGEVEEAVTFPIRLAAVIPFDKVVWTPTGTATHCSGPGHADPGYLCVYSHVHGSLESPEVRNWEGPSRAEGTGHFGFVLDWLVKGADAIDIGTYTVTAP